MIMRNYDTKRVLQPLDNRQVQFQKVLILKGEMFQRTRRWHSTTESCYYVESIEFSEGTGL
jgi:hypothetical protein